MTTTYAMSDAEREQLLSQARVGVLSVAAGGGRGPVTAPVWDSYQPGGPISFVTGRESRKGRALQAAGRAGFRGQSEDRPYEYSHRRSARRAGRESTWTSAWRWPAGIWAPKAVISTRRTTWIRRRAGLFRIEPEHWLSVDYGKDPG